VLIAILTGLVAAFLASMPVAGPVAALVVRHALEGRPRSALALGIGTGIAEGIYAFLALWGFATFLVDYPIVVPISKIVAALILIGLGFWFTRFVPHTPGAPEEVPPPSGHPHHKHHTVPSLEVARVMSLQVERPVQSLGVGFSVTFLNPTLLATWAAATTTIMSFGLFPVEPSHALPFALGVVLGASGWFALLVWLLSRYRHHFSPLTLQRVIRGMGWGLTGLGIWFAIAFVLYIAR
jgi:threonine/homoserine/homoserine lactone efflux protein